MRDIAEKLKQNELINTIPAKNAAEKGGTTSADLTSGFDLTVLPINFVQLGLPRKQNVFEE